MIGRLVNNKKRGAIVLALAFTLLLLVALPAMAADTTLSVTSPAIGENQINMVEAGTDVTFEAANPGGEGVMYTFWVCGPNGWGEEPAQVSASNALTLPNVQPGTYTVDVYCWDATGELANARQSILVGSSVVFTEKSYKDGKITLTAQASNITGVPDYQFWYKDSEGWKCAKDYDPINTVSFDATAGETYEVAVYAKDFNGSRHWKHAAAASANIKATEGGDVPGASIKLIAPTEPVLVNPAGATAPVEISVELLGFAAGVEATIGFESTWGQIVKEETTTNQKVTIKLYPEEDPQTVTAVITAKVLSAKNPATGQIYNEYKNVAIARTEVVFMLAGSAGEGKVYKLNNALSDQADRVYIKLDKTLTEQALAYAVANPAMFKVYDNIPVNKYTRPIAVSNVKQKDTETLVLILDRNDVNFPLTDNVKHEVQINGRSADLIYFTGEAQFILEDSKYIKMMKVYTEETNETVIDLKKNQLLVVFNEAVNDATAVEAGYKYSVRNLKNWVISGLNLAIDPTGPILVDVVDVNTDTLEREGVILTFKHWNDVKTFLVDDAWYKLQVNTLGDWASVTDSMNIVATQELEYPNVAFPPITVSWFEDNDTEYDLDGNDESPEQFVVNFSEPVQGGTFEIIIPDQTKVDPYGAGRFATLTEQAYNGGNDTQGFTVTKLSDSKYLIEMNQDWTKFYDTKATELNYHVFKLNPIRLIAKNWDSADIINRFAEDVAGSRARTATPDLRLYEDTQSPYTVEKVQLTSIIGGPAEAGEITRDAGAVRIAMNEPCQFKDQFNTIVAPGLTASQQQEARGGVDVNTFEYIQLYDKDNNAIVNNITVEGKIVAFVNHGNIEAARDFAIVVEPVRELNLGQWKLVIRAISDDVGNTMKTEEMLIDIKPYVPVVPVLELKLLAADAHHDIVAGDGEDSNIIGVHRTWLGNRYAQDHDFVNDAADIIHVLFNKNMALTGDNSVLNKGNYRLNGEPLPVDGTEIVRGIRGEAGLETSQTGVTIILPDGYLQERDNNHTLTIMNVFEATLKESVNVRVQLPYSWNGVFDMHAAAVVVDKAALNAKITESQALNEADYTAESWAPFKAALDAAVAVANDANATQAQVDAALADLNAKKAALVPVGGGFAKITAADVFMKQGFAGINFGVKVDFPAGVTNVKITKVDGLAIAPAKALTSGTFASVPGNYDEGNNEVEFMFDSDNGMTYTTTVKGNTATAPEEVVGPIVPTIKAADVTTKQGFAGINFGVKVDFPAGVTNVKITKVDGLAIAPAKAMTDGQFASVPGNYSEGANVIEFSYDSDGTAKTATITK